MATPSSQTKNHGKALAIGISMGLMGLGILAQEGLAATRPIRPGGSTPPPTVVDPNPPPRPSQMTAGRNAGNMVLSTPISRTAAAPSTSPQLNIKVTTDP
jgi:hypothetical protein